MTKIAIAGLMIWYSVLFVFLYKTLFKTNYDEDA